MYCPDRKEVLVGVNCLFNEIIPTYTEEYYNESQKLKFELVQDTRDEKSYQIVRVEQTLDAAKRAN